MSEVLAFGSELPSSSEVLAQTSAVLTPTWTTKAVPNLTLRKNNLTTPLPSGLVKMLGHSLDAVMPPNHRSSPNPKMKFGRERDKQIQVISSKSQQQEARGAQGFISRFGNPTKELLRPCCWGDHKDQSLFHLLASLKATTKVTWAFH